MMTIFTFNDGGEVELTNLQVQQIAESYSWPYEWQVASELKAERDAYRAQLDKVAKALKYLLDGCDEADARGELSDWVDGAYLDDARAAIAAWELMTNKLGHAKE